MGPLVYYCRWRNARLRLRGRDDQAVWGQLIFTDEAGGETAVPFHFDLATSRLTLTEGGREETLQLDELGVVVRPAAGDDPA